jgi:arylformamidase
VVGDPRLVDLSVMLVPGKETRRLEIRPFIYQHDKTTMHEVDMESHLGTHVEAPSHYVVGGKDLAGMPLDTFLGEGVVLRCSLDEPGQPIGPQQLQSADQGRVKPGDIVLLSCFPQSEDRRSYLSPEGAMWLFEKKAKMIGFDNSLREDPPGKTTTHEILLKNDVPLIENLTNLDKVTEPRVLVIALPLFIDGLDSSPVRAIAVEGFL